MSIEYLSSSITQENLENGRILIMTLTDMEDETIKLWYDACLHYMEQCYRYSWSLRILQDYSASNEAITPFSREMGQKLTQAFPSVTGRIALIYPRKFTSTIIQLTMFLRAIPPSHRTRRMFLERESALAWLGKGILNKL